MMQERLNLGHFKQSLIAEFQNAQGSSPTQEIFSNEAPSNFFRFSFHNRRTFERQLKLLTLLAKTEQGNRFQAKTNYYLLATAWVLKRDAEIAGNSAEEKIYAEKIAAHNRSSQPTAPGANGLARQSALHRFKSDMLCVLSIPYHVSDIITVLSVINLYRLLTVFARMSLKTCLDLGSQISVPADSNISWIGPLQPSALDIPKACLNFLSVFLFAARLAAHMSMIIKHTLFGQPGEQVIDCSARAWREFSTRMAHMMNDTVWVLVNLLTNYKDYWGMSDPFSNHLMAMGLVWDFSWLAIHFYREELDWAEEKTLLESLKTTSSPINLDDGEQAFIELQLNMLVDIQLELRAKYMFMIAAGLLILGAYLVILAAISPLCSALAFSICVFGFAMYGSAEYFAGWARARYGQLSIQNEESDLSAKFRQTFANLVLPPFIGMALLSLGWQFAAVGAVIALAYPYIFSPSDSDSLDLSETNPLSPTN